MELCCSFKREIDHKTEIFGDIAHRLVLYEKSGIQSGKSFKEKGIKTIQFIRTSSGWKISSLAWDDERPGITIPEKL